MNRFFILILLIYLMVSPVFSGLAQWKATGGTIQFQIKNAGLTVDGSFKNLELNIQFNPEFPEKARMEAKVWVESIETGINLRNKHLKKEEYFHVDKFPEIYMKLMRLQKAGSGWKGSFQLTLKGTTRLVEIPIEFTEIGSSAILKGKFELNRLDYGIGGKSWTMADRVAVSINILLAPEKV